MKNIGYVFKDKQLLERALTHSSLSEKNYERLEFLGDSILDFVVGEYFFQKCNDSEGKLTVLRSHYVSENYLSSIFDKLKIAQYVRLGKSYQGEISKAIKADIVEALIGAIYLDSDLDQVKTFIYTKFNLESYTSITDENYKSKLQELVQGNFKCKMSYVTNADNDVGFTAEFYMDEDKISAGKGSTKQQAEQMAAKSAIDKLFLINN